MGTIKLDEELLREALESDFLCSPGALDGANCPVWLNKWLRKAWWAIYRGKRAKTVAVALESNPPDDDLAAWLAENVMGWHVYVGYVYHLEPWWTDKGGVLLVAKDSWDPLANDAQAMMVLDRMVELGWDMELDGDSDGWFARFRKEAIKPNSALTQARNIAICRAAKAAIEAERAQEAERRPSNCPHCGAVRIQGFL